MPWQCCSLAVCSMRACGADAAGPASGTSAAAAGPAGAGCCGCPVPALLLPLPHLDVALPVAREEEVALRHQGVHAGLVPALVLGQHLLRGGGVGWMGEACQGGQQHSCCIWLHVPSLSAEVQVQGCRGAGVQGAGVQGCRGAGVQGCRGAGGVRRGQGGSWATPQGACMPPRPAGSTCSSCTTHRHSPRTQTGCPEG